LELLGGCYGVRHICTKQTNKTVMTNLKDLKSGDLLQDEMGRFWVFLHSDEDVQNSGFNTYFKVARIKQAWRHGAIKLIDFHERVKSNGEVEGYYRHEFKKVK
jgi:hypothetical protein